MNFGKLGQIVLGATIVLGTVGILSANAQSDYTKERINAMKTIGGAMKNGDVAAANAGYITLAALWPAGSQGAYRAKSEIWNADGSLNTEVVAILEKGAVATSIDEVKGTCGACHENFRGPKP